LDSKILNVQKNIADVESKTIDLNIKIGSQQNIKIESTSKLAKIKADNDQFKNDLSTLVTKNIDQKDKLGLLNTDIVKTNKQISLLN